MVQWGWETEGVMSWREKLEHVGPAARGQDPGFWCSRQSLEGLKHSDDRMTYSLKVFRGWRRQERTQEGQSGGQCRI